MVIDFEILPDPADPRSSEDLLVQIDNALGNSTSALRSGPSGFLLDNAKFTINPLAVVPPPVIAQSPPQQSFQWVDPAPQQVAQMAELQRIEQAGPQVFNPPPEPPMSHSLDLLLVRISEQSKELDDLKAARMQADAEKASLLQRVADSETALLDKMRELDKSLQELEQARKDVFFAREDAAEAQRNLAQAKEMWMKESARATKLRDQLDKAELAIAELQKEISKQNEKFKKTETENLNLKHLINKSNEIVSTQVLTAQTVEPGFAPSDSYFVRGGTMASLRANPLMTEKVVTGASMLITPQPSMSGKFLQLTVTNDGVLFEDETIQIGIKAKFTGLGEGVLGVYFGNKTSGVLQNFQVRYSMDTCGPNLHLTIAPVPSQLGPKNQVCQRVSAQLTGAFTECPKMVVSYLLPDNTPRTIPLKLPVTVNKFMQVRDLSSEEFFSNWRQQMFLLNEASSVVNVGMNLAQIARASQLGGALSLHHQIDQVADNLVLVGQFPSDSPDGIRCATIPEALVLVRVEVGSGPNAGKARIAVRSNDSVVAEAVRACLANQLAV